MRRRSGTEPKPTGGTYVQLRTVSDLQKHAENVCLTPLEERRLVFQHFPQDDQAVFEFLGILIESMRTVGYQHSLKFRTRTHAPSDAPRTARAR